jgi:hypothetical protein
MRKLMIAALLTSLFPIGAMADKQLRPWGEWSQKDAQKILDDSPWGRTQTETDTSEMFFQPTTSGGPNGTTRAKQGATNTEVHVNFHIRFFTARPIRQALVRLLELSKRDLPSEAIGRLNDFANLHSADLIIVTVAFDSTDQRYSGPVMQAFGSSTTDSLKNNTYLERKDGKRVFLTEYVPPGKDGFGARFIFPRQVDGQPFLNVESGEVRFYSAFSTRAVGSSIQKPQSDAKGLDLTAITLDRRFKIADMIFDGQLEY